MSDMKAQPGWLTEHPASGELVRVIPLTEAAAEIERLREEREGFMEQMNRMELETQAALAEVERLRNALA